MEINEMTEKLPNFSRDLRSILHLYELQTIFLQKQVLTVQ